MSTIWNAPVPSAQQTLMVHECLVVAAALGQYHHWQRRASHQDRDTHDWKKVPVIPKDDFQHKYSPALTLLGNGQNPAYAHPKTAWTLFPQRLLLRANYRGSVHEGKITPLRGEDQAHLRPRVRGASPPVGEYAGPYP